MAKKPFQAKKQGAVSLEDIKTKDDITLDNVYALGLEHDLENLTPETNPDERERMKTAELRTKK